MKLLKSTLLLVFIALSLNNAKADPVPLKVALQTVTKAYLEVKNALIANNAATVQNKAMDLVRALNSVPDMEMTVEEHRMWFDYLNKLQYDSRHINESGSIDHQREHFSDLSENLFLVLKKFNRSTITLYKQYSPADRGYWISETSAIKNPYNGTGNSLTKGETRDVLKAK